MHSGFQSGRDFDRSHLSTKEQKSDFFEGAPKGINLSALFFDLTTRRKTTRVVYPSGGM
jgi:hypothetical protein